MRVTRRVRRRLLVALVVYAALLALVLLAPSSGIQSAMASWISDLGISQAQAEFVGNVLIVAPLTAACALAWPRTAWWTWTAGAFVLASAVEIVQAVVLPDRTASYVDVIANTLGGLVGAALVVAWRRVR